MVERFRVPPSDAGDAASRPGGSLAEGGPGTEHDPPRPETPTEPGAAASSLEEVPDALEEEDEELFERRDDPPRAAFSLYGDYSPATTYRGESADLAGGGAAASDVGTPQRSRRRWVPWAVGGAVGAAVAGGAVVVALTGGDDPAAQAISNPSAPSRTAAPVPTPDPPVPTAPGGDGTGAPDVDATVPPASELVPVGESATVGSWEITLEATDLDAQATIDAGDNPLYDGLADGEVLVLTTATVTNTANEPLDPGLDLLTGFLGADGVEYNVLNGGVCLADESLLDVGEIGPGESVSGSVCQAVPGDAVADGSWIVRPAENYTSRVAFAVE
ncbi:hypothetical protein [Georgenia subflava]|uniref:DUF4352 domain-containing protein n=1 Tax=Georgenia subflava TaxID=1622177 RepID=A0A6N7EGD7_9MICO|nr:hypothetical protein [Georgenia subflava]MPV37452.1 hypothetical protein [Georgenia subflava]